jgi:hypothetical protein
MTNEEASTRLALLHARSIQSSLHSAVTDIQLEQRAGVSGSHLRALIERARRLLRLLHGALVRVPPGVVRDRLGDNARRSASELARAEAD